MQQKWSNVYHCREVRGWIPMSLEGLSERIESNGDDALLLKLVLQHE